MSGSTNRFIPGWPRWGWAVDVVGLVLLAYLFVERFDLRLLLTDTMLTGGDSASWYQSAVFLRDTLLPNGRLFGWDQSNFFGYPNFQYYFVPPFLLAVMLGELIPLSAALKIVTFSAVLLIPFAVYVSLRLLRYQRPMPLAGAWTSLAFVFHERFNMFGGNVLSTLAGEFSYGIAFALQILFMGLLYRGITERRYLAGNATLLALIGLCHAFVFLAAVLMPLWFLFVRKDFGARFAYLFWIYWLAFLLMALWAVPMVLQLGYTTPIQMIWRFFSLEGFLSALNYEVLLAAGLLTVLVLALHRRGLHLGLFLYMVAISGLLYLIATALKVADIRFFPPILFFALMAIVDCGAGLLRASGPYRTVAGTSLVGLAVIAGGLWAYEPSHEASAWFKWNYSGYETKPAFRDGTIEGLAEVLRAPPDAARVAWEKTSYDLDYGSDRVFESIPLLFGRRSTEGIHYGSALLSKAITWLHGEYSPATASPEALINPHYSPQIVPERFPLFNIDTILVRTPQMKQLFAASPDFVLQARVGEMSLFRTATPAPGYISTPRFHPVPVTIESGDWRRAFLFAFRRGEGMDPPLVDARRVDGSGEAGRFLPPRAQLDDYGRLQCGARLGVTPAHITETAVSDFAIRFRTDSPGQPHLVRVAFSPNWRSRGGEPIYPVSLGLMLLFPQTEEVELVYGRHWSEYLGMLLTLVGLFIAIAIAVDRRACRVLLAMPGLGRLAGLLWRIRAPLLLGVAAALMTEGVKAYHVKQLVFADYFEGNRLAAEGRYSEAVAAYRRAGSDRNVRRLDKPDVPNSIFALARLYRSHGDPAAAEREMRRLIDAYPGWLHVHEVYLELGELLEQRGAQAEAASLFRACAQIDRFSPAGERCRARVETIDRARAEPPAVNEQPQDQGR